MLIQLRRDRVMYVTGETGVIIIVISSYKTQNITHKHTPMLTHPLIIHNHIISVSPPPPQHHNDPFTWQPVVLNSFVSSWSFDDSTLFHCVWFTFISQICDLIHIGIQDKMWVTRVHAAIFLCVYCLLWKKPQSEQHDNLVFQREEIFIQLEDLYKLERITHAWIAFNYSLIQAQKHSSVMVKCLTAKQAIWVQSLVMSPIFCKYFLFNSSN